MRVVVLGSTGGTGRLTIRKLLQHEGELQPASAHHASITTRAAPVTHACLLPAGVQVVAVARSPAALDGLVAELAAGRRLSVLRGDLMDAPSLAPAMAGEDVVVFAAGIASIKQAATSKTTVYSVGK